MLNMSNFIHKLLPYPISYIQFPPIHTTVMSFLIEGGTLPVPLCNKIWIIINSYILRPLMFVKHIEAPSNSVRDKQSQYCVPLSCQSNTTQFPVLIHMYTVPTSWIFTVYNISSDHHILLCCPILLFNLSYFIATNMFTNLFPKIPIIQPFPIILILFPNQFHKPS